MQLLEPNFDIDQYNPINPSYYAYFKKAQKEANGNQALFNALMQRYREDFLKGKEPQK